MEGYQQQNPQSTHKTFITQISKLLPKLKIGLDKNTSVKEIKTALMESQKHIPSIIRSLPLVPWPEIMPEMLNPKCLPSFVRESNFRYLHDIVLTKSFFHK